MNTVRILGACMAIGLLAQPLLGQQPGWAFTAGVAVGGENVYPGSGDYYLTPLPSMSASYNRGNATYSLSLLEGLGISYVVPKWGLIASANVNAGARRDPESFSVLGITVDHSPTTRALLVGTSDLHTPLVLNTGLFHASPIGLLGLSLGVHRTSVESPQAPQQSEVRNGLVYSLVYMAGGQVSERFSLSGLLSLDFMDQTYADTWHTRRQSASAGVFEADAGLRSSMVALEAEYRLSERVSLSVVGASTILMADAKASPFTVETVQRTMRTQVLYHF